MESESSTTQTECETRDGDENPIEDHRDIEGRDEGNPQKIKHFEAAQVKYLN